MAFVDAVEFGYFCGFPGAFCGWCFVCSLVRVASGFPGASVLVCACFVGFLFVVWAVGLVFAGCYNTGCCRVLLVFVVFRVFGCCCFHGLCV